MHVPSFGWDIFYKYFNLDIMKKLPYIFFFFASICTITAQKSDCLNFRTGKFEYTDSQYSRWKVIRTESTQTEVNSTDGVEIQGDIEWKSDCEYILTYGTNDYSKKKGLAGKKVFVEIIKAEGNKYTCLSKCDAVEITTEIVKL